jgi:ABC-type transport system involved in cytochrome bd biosynthesis fused ATPase/permease subunit
LWIQNCSIRDNIVGVRDFEPEWYASVVQACALDTDIESLSEGDGTNAGSAGSALSGGQKLRIVSYVLFTTYLQLLNLNRHLQELFIRGIKSSS